jgi:hypothetical protein
MNIKKILITELEKKKILKMYGVLKEDTPTPVVEPKSNELLIDNNVKFPAGFYSKKYLAQSELPKEIAKIIQYLKSNNSAFVVDITTESSESKIPNTDKELGLPSPKNRVNTGYLSKKRSESIVKYIKDSLAPYTGPNKLILELPKLNIGEAKLGGTKWIGQPFCPQKLLPSDDTQGYACLEKDFNPGDGVVNWTNGKESVYKETAEQYKREQSIRVIIKVIKMDRGSKKCLDNMTIEVNYTNLAKKHTCNSAIYNIFIRGDLSKYPADRPGILLRRDDGAAYASLNNNSPQAKNVHPDLIKFDNSPTDPNMVSKERYNKFIITPEIATSLLTDGSTKFIISAKCRNLHNNPAWNGGCHEGVGNIIITNGKGVPHPYDEATPKGNNEVKTLVPIDACGTKVEV